MGAPRGPIDLTVQPWCNTPDTETGRTMRPTRKTLWIQPFLGCPTGLEPVTSCSTDKRSAIELRAPYTRRRRRECKPSSVLDGHLSRSRRTGHVVAFMTALDFRPWRAACKRSNRRLLRGGLPFSLRRPKGRRLGLCCSRAKRRANLDCQRDESRFPGFHRAPMLYAARTFL